MICSDFWKHLTTADLANGGTASPFVLHAGLTPTWNAWREECFGARKQAFAALWNAFIKWREVVMKGASSCKHLPVFWIEGPPGDGKSVLLLQLMAACLREQLTPAIAWLEHSPDGRAFHTVPPPDCGWVFCAEIPTRMEGTVRDAWMAGLRNAGATALVTSGSSEIRHGFAFHFEFCAEVTKFVLPPFSLSEATDFAAWFHTRTEISRDVGMLWREGMSLAEFLFALHHGRPLADLTSDVRGALGNLGLGGRARVVWLANALGLRAPGSLLATDAARDHAVKIAERGVVPVEVNEAGLQLAPPTIAWPMVGSWLAEKHELHHLTEALAYVLKAWLDASDEENAVRFLRQLWGTEWLIDEKPVGHGNPFFQLKRKEVLRQLYRAHRRDFGGQPASATIPTWLEINEAFSLMLLPDPVVCATELFTKPENESRRTPSLAATTWLAADSRRDPAGLNAREAVADYFLSPVSGLEAGRALMKIIRNTKNLPEARVIGETWIKLFPDEDEALDVACALVKRAGNSEKFLAWAMEQFARPNASRSGSAKFFAARLEGRPHDEALRKQAAAWAWSHPLEAETGIVWFTLMMEKLAKEDVLRGVMRWLGEHPAHSISDVMRLRVLTHYPNAYGAAWVMREWFKRHTEDEHTPGLLLKLLEAQPNSRIASAAALEWLDHSLTNPASPALLRFLLKHPDDALQSVAERWFDANPNSESYATLLAEFIRELRGNAKWIERGEGYAENPQHAGREIVLASLLAVNGCQLRYAQMALQLLPELSDKQRTLLETSLSHSLARNLLQAEKVFRQFAGTSHLSDLARITAYGLMQITDTRVEFMRRVLPTLDGEATFLMLHRLVWANARGSEIIQAILNWVRENYRQRGYWPMLGALHSHPKVWQCLLATTRLDKRVITDFQNYSPQSAEAEKLSGGK